MDEKLLIVGINHRTAPVAVRERLAYDDGEIVATLGRLRDRAPALAEAALISTCNRIEIVGVATDSARAIDETTSFLVADREADAALFAGALYRFEGRDAVRHLFRVASSLDSMVVGEAQILGQVKERTAVDFYISGHTTSSCIDVSLNTVTVRRAEHLY